MTCEDWPITPDPECCPGWDELDPAAQARGIRFASQVLWALSGRQWRICATCVRPCEVFCLCCTSASYRPPGWWAPGVAGIGWGPRIVDGEWVNCGCACSSCCKAACAVRLAPGPVREITEVRIDGQVVDPGTYQVIDGRLLVRSAAAGCWPECNDLSLADTESGTWSVSYRYGLTPPATALDMAAVLACEAAKRCAGKKCRISGRITQLDRDGVTMTLDPAAFFDAGLTGLPEVDAWLRSVNPYRLAAAGQVWSPDVKPPSVVSWPSGVC